MTEQQKEYSIEVIMKPHYHDNKKYPFFWCVYEMNDEQRVNIGCGWAATPECAFCEAHEFWSKL